MQPIITTMSFRAAWYFGCPHLAGHTVTLTREERGDYRVDHTSGTLARVAYPQSVREPGGVPRAAEARHPHKVPRWARDPSALNFAKRHQRRRQAPIATEGFGGALAIRAMLDPPKELDR